jgi:hypothetical protein
MTARFLRVGDPPLRLYIKIDLVTGQPHLSRNESAAGGRGIKLDQVRPLHCVAIRQRVSDAQVAYVAWRMSDAHAHQRGGGNPALTFAADVTRRRDGGRGGGRVKGA